MQADLHSVKNAVSSAIDVMQSMGSSVCSLLDKVWRYFFLFLLPPNI
jgi:QWRF family